MLSHQFNRARGKGAYGLATGVVRVSQWFTDLANWSKVQVRVKRDQVALQLQLGHTAAPACESMLLSGCSLVSASAVVLACWEDVLE